MGSPISPILADLVMGVLLKVVKNQLDYDVPILWKYVDDLLIALPFDRIQSTLDIFNAYNNHIQFTLETEENRQLPFLDTVITRHEDQTLSTRWYCKPIASGRLLNFHSFHPLAMKMNVATNFIKRVIGLTTDQSMTEQKQLIFQHLRRNDYPSALINRLLSRINHPKTATQRRQHPTTSITISEPQDGHQRRHEQPEDTDDDNIQPQSTASTTNPTSPIARIAAMSEPSLPIYRALPYIPQLTATLISILRKDFPQVKIARRTIRTTAQLVTSTKDPIDAKLQHNVVYSIPCNDCEKVYIGMTTQHLRGRLYGHQSNVNQYNRLIAEGKTKTDAEMTHLGEKTALVEHSIQQEHTFDLTKTKILDKTYRTAALPILEMCHISGQPNTVNHRTDVDGLSIIYSGIIQSITTKNTRRKTHSTNTNQ